MSRGRKKDWELWERVKKTTKPLRDKSVSEGFETLFNKNETSNISEAVRSVESRTIKPVPTRAEPKIRFSPLPEPPKLDSSIARKIAKGRLPIEGTIDLHGMTQSQAYGRLLRFVEYGYQHGARTVLVITGKGVGGDGILRKAVPRWLTEPDFRRFVVGHHESHRSHGGSGAIYVRIKRK